MTGSISGPWASWSPQGLSEEVRENQTGQGTCREAQDREYQTALSPGPLPPGSSQPPYRGKRGTDSE